MARNRSYTHPDLPHMKRTLYHLSYRGGKSLITYFKIWYYCHSLCSVTQF